MGSKLRNCCPTRNRTSPDAGPKPAALPLCNGTMYVLPPGLYRRRYLTGPHPLFTGQFIGSMSPLNLPTDYPFIGFMTSTYSARLPQHRTSPERTVTIRLFYWSDNPVPHQEAYARSFCCGYGWN